MAKLYIYPKEGNPWKLEVDREAVSIGRAQGNDVAVADPNCSSRHAYIERAEGGFVIRDAGSKNGTFVNGRRIDCPAVLSPGDEIAIGLTTMTFEKPRMPRVSMVDSPSSATDGSAVVPFRTILDKTSATDARTSPLAAPADLKEENRILQVMFQVSEALVAHKPLQELLEDIMDLIAENIPMDQCVIMLRGDGSSALEPRAARIQGQWRGGGEIQVSRTIVAMAYEQHLSVLLSDAAADPRVASNVSIIEKGILSALCVPIGDDQEVIGVLYADRHAHHEPFRDADLRLLTLLANTAAVRIQQARQVAALIGAAKLQRDIETAAAIQRDFLPQSLPSYEGYGMAGRAVPCHQVGGDYYDLVSLDADRIGLAVADVSGKGVGAALLMASLRAWLHAELVHGSDLTAIAAKLNDFIHRSSDIHSFITFFFAELDRKSGGLRFINAGHNPALVFGRDGLVRELPATGLCLGMFAGRSFEVGTGEVGPGEILVLYTDGITESRNSGEKEFGVEGLTEAIREDREKDAPTILEGVFRRLAEFTACAEPFDDRTLVVVKRNAFESARPL
ncbi:MAG: SpoIIE family protein phosphatase [Candidatus Aminicenantes bacterium]|nr:SpoIIE family protein phosphatase [Candidatus Aminicenantes bacterium]